MEKDHIKLLYNVNNKMIFLNLIYNQIDQKKTYFKIVNTHH